MPEMIGGMCTAIVVLGTIYSSFGLRWSALGKRLYWIVGLILAFALIGNRINLF
jgi:hypothetical protein